MVLIKKKECIYGNHDIADINIQGSHDIAGFTICQQILLFENRKFAWNFKNQKMKNVGFLKNHYRKNAGYLKCKILTIKTCLLFCLLFY